MVKKSLSINAVLNATRSVLNMLFPLITYPYITAVLSVDELGKYSFSLSIINYFALIAGLGVSSYAIREGARIRDDKKALSLFANHSADSNAVFLNTSSLPPDSCSLSSPSICIRVLQLTSRWVSFTDTDVPALPVTFPAAAV